MGYTIITHFSADGYKIIHSLFEHVTEKICRVPYGRVEDKLRHSVDTLPYHITLSTYSGRLNSLLSKLEGFSYPRFEVMISGVDMMPGKNRSRVLYFEVAPSHELDLLQEQLNQVVGKDSCVPEKSKPHITICISKDFRKLERVRRLVLSDFEPFSLTVISLVK